MGGINGDGKSIESSVLVGDIRFLRRIASSFESNHTVAVSGKYPMK